MSAYVLLNLLNELGEKENVRLNKHFIALLQQASNKFNNTRAQMLYSIHHMTFRLL